VVILSKLTGYTGPVHHSEARTGDVKHSLADITLARKALGYEPSVPFEEGLRRTVQWYKAAMATSATARE
jgi:UDP-glucose 4-epimerase